VPSPAATPTVVPPVVAPPVLQAVKNGTTIPPDVLDPNAPVPTVDPKLFVVYDCARGIPGATIQAK
jgi:hypothetical protein